MKKLIPLVILIWQVGGSLWAQKNLSSIPFEALLEQSEKYIYKNLDSALFYQQMALNIAYQKGESVQVFEAYRTQGYIYEENSLLQEALKSYQKALTLANEKLSDKERCKIYNDWAIINKKLGHYAIANDFHWLTIQLAEKTNNWEVVESGYNGLGTMYHMMNSEDKAIYFYQKSIEAAEKWGNKLGVVLTLENIAGVYIDLKNWEIASQNIEKAYKMALALNDSSRIAAILNLSGDIENAKGKYDLALEYYKKSETIARQNEDKAQLSRVLLSLGTYYFEQKNYEKAEESFSLCQTEKSFLSPVCTAELYQKLGKLYTRQKRDNKAISAFMRSIQITDSLELKEMARANHLALADILNAQNKHQEAYAHIAIANELGDSLYAQAKEKNAKALIFKYEIEKKDIQINAQNREIKHANTTRLILGFSLVLVSGLLLFTWRQMKAKLDAMNHIELLMKELHHRVKNNLQTVTSIMRLQARHITDPTVLSVLGESRSRLEAISMIHQQLYRSDDVQSVNFKLFLEGLVEKQIFAHGMSDKDIETEIILENEFLNVDLALPLGLIINELLTNSFKYAYPSVSHPKLQIEVSTQKLFYADNGQGLPTQFSSQNSKSFGIQLITSLAQQLHGKFSFGNDNGMFFKLIFS